jgi:hypothetical protein
VNGERAASVFTLVRVVDLERYHRRRDAGAPGPRLLVFRRDANGQVSLDDFPDETDVCEAIVGLLDPEVARLERGRLYVSVANGRAVYVPVGPSPLPHCVRYGRLYLHRIDD